MRVNMAIGMVAGQAWVFPLGASRLALGDLPVFSRHLNDPAHKKGTGQPVVCTADYRSLISPHAPACDYDE